MESFSRKEKFIFDNHKGQTLELSVLSPFYLDRASGIESLDNNLFTTSNYAEDGEVFLGSNIQKRNILFEGRLRQSMKEVNRPILIKFFNPNHYFTLKYTNGEVEKFIKCRVEKTPVINKEIHAEFIISIICLNPWWYEKEIKTEVASWIGAFEFPLEIPKETGIRIGYREPSVIANIVNESDNAAPIKLEFRAVGTVTNPSILNLVTLEKIEIERVMTSGDIITINTERGNEYVKLLRGGVESNIFNDLSLDSKPQMMLDLGDNMIRYDASTNVDNLEVTIYFTPQFVGV